MRFELSKIEDQRATFTGEFVRLGIKGGWKGTIDTILLKNIKDIGGRPITNHLWFNYTKGFKSLGDLKEGNLIQFDGRSKAYLKGYKGRRIDVYKPFELDFKLSHPTKIKLLK